MEAAATHEKPATVWKWKKPDHKLSPEEIEAIIEHWDYQPDNDGEFDECNADGISLLNDKFGNPTYGYFESVYEVRHGLCKPMTLEDLFLFEDDEDALYSDDRQVQAQ